MPLYFGKLLNLATKPFAARPQLLSLGRILSDKETLIISAFPEVHGGTTKTD
jgi:hypothetical protein